LREHPFEIPHIVAVDTDPSLVDNLLMPTPETVVLYGDGTNPQVILACGVQHPAAIFVTYEDPARVFAATSRLRFAFKEAPIYVRAQTRAEAQKLRAAGATEVIVESDELSRSAVDLVLSSKAKFVSSNQKEALAELFECMDQDLDGTVSVDEISAMLRKSNSGITSDEEIEMLELWARNTVPALLDYDGFCRIFASAPEVVQVALGDACVV
jgi:Trk K+ transport system NAD-binding subunit